MDCIHPVLYMRQRDGAMVCHICGAVIPAEPPQELPQEVQKPAPKRGKKTKAD